MGDDLDRIRFHLDAVAGAQLAMMAAFGVLLARHKGDPQVLAAVRLAGEHLKCDLLNEKVSDYKIGAFDATLESLLESLA